jgi:LysR family transcriptional regulator of beta-lactamase
VFDTSLAMVEAALLGAGVALAPPSMFEAVLAGGRLVQPFATTVPIGRYWLTWLNSRRPTTAMATFRDWLATAAAPEPERAGADVNG